MSGVSGTAPDLAALAAALAGNSPTGVDLRQDFSAKSPYYRLRDARAEARELERRADHDPSGEGGVAPQWRVVRELATQALTTQTKDLEILAWLTEAMVRFDGLSGLAAGAATVTALVGSFWDASLFPMPDEDGMETRVAPLAGLNGIGADGTLMQPLRKTVLFASPDGVPVTFWEFAQSEELEAITDAARRKTRLAAGVVPLEDLDRQARAQGAAHFVALRADAKAALAAWTGMGEALDARAGADAPPVGRVRDVLAAILAVLQRYAPPELPGPMAAPEEGDAGGEAVAGAAPAVAAARPQSREDMLHELARIADYFRRTEPHSPLAYTLEEAVRRGRLTWPELLAEVVPDQGSRSAILVMLGIRPTPPAG